MERTADKTRESTIIRVMLTLGDDVSILLNNDIIVEDENGKKLKFKFNVKSLVIKFDGNKILFNNELLDDSLLIYSKDEGLISINNKDYFGSLKIIPHERGFMVVNYLPLETYLMSVAPSEVPVKFDEEAIKAQVVAARTYAYYSMKRNNKRDFDVDDTVRYQVYNGYNIDLNNQHIKKIYKAIDDTRSQIVTYNGEPILAYFHSNSGGKTRSGGDYFGPHSDLPYLVGHDDPYSIDLPGSNWEYRIGFDDFNKALSIQTDLTDDALIYNKDNFSYDNDGFIEKIKVLEREYYPKEIRRSVGYVNLRSERFYVELNYTDRLFDFKGIGFGHGVGMSQWGAEGMAQKGFNYKEIILFYYPNTIISGIVHED